MKRVKHVVIGMLMGWLALQAVMLLGMLCAAVADHVRNGRGDWSFLCVYLGIFAVCSAVVCLGAWLLIYLPVYWCWPRGESWSWGGFTSAGAASGIMIGLLYFSIITSHSLLVTLITLMLPAVTGGVGALAGWWCEEKERRFLEWQKQVTTPIQP